jgi:hypothetical protein
MWIELIGIAATVFVLFSFLMKDLTRVRIINIIGAILFVLYGVLIGAMATWLLNGILVIVHIVCLARANK